jgi:stage III sporulation protein AE
MAGKRMVLFIPACLLCLVCSFNVAAQEQEQVFDREQIIREQMEALDFEKIEAFIADLNRQGAKYVPEINLQELVARVARGEEAFNLRALLGGLLQYLFQEVVANSHLLGKLLLLAVIAAVLNNIQQAFTAQEVGQVAYSVCFPGFAGPGSPNLHHCHQYRGGSCRKNGNLYAGITSRFTGHS